MLFAFIGCSCTGKSLAAETFQKSSHAAVYTGKDYLKLAKSPSQAKSLFEKQLQEAVSSNELTIFVISEMEEVNMLPEGAKKVLFTADLETIKSRFAVRMHGNLPAPVGAMLERKAHLFLDGTYDLTVHSDTSTPEEICASIRQVLLS
ncbi:MAG: hypothetical protein E7256_13200 [Lachnospiraceae bacterium]|nr:hypothetical protein [Lachnospiraceae bacterium]